MCETTDGTPCPCSEAPSDDTTTRKARVCETTGCGLNSGEHRFCRKCRTVRPWREKVERMMSAMRAGGLGELDDDQVIGCVRARMLVWDDNEQRLSGEILSRVAAQGERDEAIDALHRLAGVETMETKPDVDGCEALVRQELHDRLAMADRRAKERDSATALLRGLTGQVNDLTTERDELQNENAAWLALGSVTPSDWDGGASEWFRSFSLWVESGARLEDWTDESGEGTVIGVVSGLARERDDLRFSLHEAREQRDAWMATAESGDAAAEEMQELTDRLLREREEIRNTMNVARDHARGLEVRLKRAKEDRDASSREATMYRKIAEAHRKIAERAADDLVASATSLDNAASDIATLRTRLHIMYAVAGLLAVVALAAAVVGGVL